MLVETCTGKTSRNLHGREKLSIAEARSKRKRAEKISGYNTSLVCAVVD